MDDHWNSNLLPGLHRQFPALAIFTADELIGSGATLGLKVLCIPFNLFPGSNGHIAKKHCLGERPRLAEVG
jgi:hypothetical protein